MDRCANILGVRKGPFFFCSSSSHPWLGYPLRPSMACRSAGRRDYLSGQKFTRSRSFFWDVRIDWFRLALIEPHGGSMFEPAIASRAQQTHPAYSPTRYLPMWYAAIVAVTLFADTATADTPATVEAPNKSEQPANPSLDSITVEAKRERAILERQVTTFVD